MLFGSLLFLFFNILSGNDMTSVKRQLSVKSLGEKFQALRELEKGLSNKDVAEKYGVPKNTISTWIKNKSKYFAALEQSSNKRKNLKCGDYERADHVYQSFCKDANHCNYCKVIYFCIDLPKSIQK